MLPLTRMMLAMILTVVVQFVNGHQNTVHVSKFISEESFISGTKCCAYGNCSCNSLDHALANLTSNTLINITTDVTLSSLVTASDIENVSIIGHNSPTVNCKGIGRIHMNFCKNCTIQGITWDECGTKNIDNHIEPCVMLSYSSTVTIQNCSFQRSVGQAVVLSKMSGDININDCKFVNNSFYGGHGAAIYYLSNNTGNPQFIFIISNCNFSYNRMKSLVYLENTSVKYNKIILTNSTFHNNQGISIYAIHHTIYLNGEVLFYNNIAENGAGIFIRDYSTIMFNSNVAFIQNTAINSGGAVFLGNHSVCLFDHNSVAIFYNNKAADGTIYTDVNCNVTFKATCKVTFSSNSVTQYGAAIYSVNDSHVTFTGNAKVTFSDNIVNPVASNDIPTFIWTGGIIYSHINSSISFEGNSHTIFSNNIAYNGGAIFSNDNSNISFKGNSYAAFSHNTAYSVGGALYSFNSSISFKENSNIEFSNNYAPYGGAIITTLSDSTFEGSSTTVFTNNVAANDGGAISSDDCSEVSFKGNSTTLFDSNTAAHRGGAISIECGNLCFKENATTVFSNNTASKGGAIYSAVNNHMYCRGNAITMFSNNTANSGGAIYSYYMTYTSLLDNSTTLFTNNTANSGGAIYSHYKTYTSLLDNSTTLFSNNSAAEYGGAIVLYLQCGITLGDKSTVTFNNNNGTFGATVFANSNSTITSKDDTNLFFNNLPARWCPNKCLAYTGQGDVITVDDTGLVWCSNQKLLRCLSSRCYCRNLENILRTGIKYNLVIISDNVVILSSAFELPHTDISIIGHNNPTVLCVNGGRLIFNLNYIYHYDIHYNLTIKGITWIGCGEVTDILFTGSSVVDDIGGVLEIFGFNKVTIQKCSFQYSVGQVVSLIDVDEVDINDCNFVRNTNNYRGYSTVIYYSRIAGYSILPVSFKYCYFSFNDGTKSVIYFDKYSYPEFNDYTYDMQIYLINSSFHNNQGVSIYLSKQQHLYISGEVSFENNVADYGAGIYMSNHSTVTFGKNSNTKFINNSVYYNGAAIFLNEYSSILFDNNSTVTFTGNRATSGTIYSKVNSNLTFRATSEVIFSSNSVTKYGTAIYSSDNSNVTFAGNAIFDNNVIPSNDMHSQLGGTVFTENNNHIFFEENSITRFSNNFADFGAAILSIYNSHIIYKDMSTIMFNNNTAHYCGALTFAVFSTVTFTDHTKVTYNANTVSHILPSNYESSAGAICTYQNCKITFSEHSSVTFTSNRASRGGAVIILEGNVFIEDYSIVLFYNNFAWYSSGGSLICSNNSNVTIGGNSNVSFNGNKASESGGAVHSYNMCKITFKDNSTSNFIDNSARNNGGAILSSEYSAISFEGNSTVTFNDNVANNGGALHFDNASNVLFSEFASVEFHYNKASYGAAIFLDTTTLMVNNSDETCLNFTNNFAKVLGSSMYQDITGLCNGNCIINGTMGINNDYIATPPNQLQLDRPATCVDEDNETQCNSYYVQNIMLGTDIALPACVLDYYNHPVNSTQFFVHSEVHPNYFNTGPKEVLIFCDKFEEINIIGNQALSKSINFSINISLNIVLNADWKEILVNLIIELSPCHLGFWQYNNSVRCECYSANDIVFCSGSSSTIKRNYWFGNVTGKPTVTFCPINYCNFSCCETSNGYYHLSPVRDNQCRSHRSGPACGNCEEGYTLSFDSPECVDVKECGIGQTILVLALILLYWVIIITAVFALMHFKVGIGYLYAITYYYSVVDLLSQSWYPSNLLYIIINVMSSIAKIIPQFLGQICFIKNMSGIDQQFIHYMHPVAISLFLVMITVLARRSRRLSTFIGKGIIHVICCLLLLSYTSLASTSLLLMRPLTFNDVDEVYTYVSPDVEYFHGRHLVYAIVAMLFTIVIVIGLPLLLALEPFLNSKINFVKIKPLLDQFQGCYKDKYRYFAAYYMICRLLIITIIIANSSNGFIFHYLLIAASVIVDLVHQCFRPYSSSLLNVFDGVILHFLVLVSVSPLVESFDSFNSNLLVGITLVLIILPALIFVTMSVMINKEKIRKLPGYCYTKWSQLRLRHYSEIPLTETEQLSESDEDEYINDIDDSMRTNATIFDV